MKRVILLLLIFVFNIAVFAQNGLLENFNDNTLDAGWETNPATNFSLTETNNELKIGVTSAGPGYQNVSFTFSPVDLTNNPIVKILVKNASSFTFRMDLVDVNGKSTNASPVSKSVTVSSVYKLFTFDFTGRFNQSSPGVSTVDKTNISKVVLFFNAGGTAYTGTVYLDDLTVGDAVPYVPGSIRVNQVGYEKAGFKSAILEATTANLTVTDFNIINASDSIVFSGALVKKGAVAGWTNRYFWEADFSAFQKEGTYRVKIDSKISYPFEIGASLLFAKTAFSIVDFFKGMRSTLNGDRSLSFNGTRNDFVDVYGGWRDATGDPGKHMSHLSYANYFNPQQIPFVTWSLLKSYQLCPSSFTLKSTALLEEAAWGNDYLLRNIDKLDYLYLAIFDDWGGAPATREICEWGQTGSDAGRTANYKAAMREGAGIAIAALARGYNMNLSGTSTPAQYLDGAKRLYAHLKSPGTGYATKNLEYCNDHSENIIDDYCGLLAAIELYKATNSPEYLTDASARVDNLLQRMHSDGWFQSNTAGRPFYHAADEGMPLLALTEYMTIDQQKNAAIISALTKSLQWYFQISNEVVNPFKYVRQYGGAYVANVLQPSKKSFFLPHDNETGYWWQGENARLASMSCALLMAAKKINSSFSIGTDSVTAMAMSQLDWILGKNPFDVSMMTGFGVNTYAEYPNSSGGTNLKGGICNGITAKDGAEENIDWMPYASNDWQNWRWIEQWLPHDAWFLLAISTIENIQQNPGPVAAFTSSPGTVCIGASSIFTNSSTGTITDYAWDFGSGATTATATTAGPHEVTWSSAGTKTISLNVAGPGGFNTRTSTVMVSDLPVQPVIQQVSGDLTSGTFQKYQWYFNDTEIPNTDAQFYTPSQNGNYKVKATDVNGCTAVSEPFNFIVTGLKEATIDGITFFPNPFRDELKLSFNGEASVKLFEITGKRVFESKGYNGTLIDTKALTKGVYFMEVKLGEKRFYKKIIKE